ncbi:MAG TPA: HPF/RaiA family ribosome-associated protein [Candidatus Sulfotelmatobacter sp.]|nr:HPF/RaiA family ribosome-associated protein [Candidatus Sulfotelmatobacter sp.]
MQIPLNVSFHNLDHSDAIEAHVRTEAEKLGKFFDRITACHVVVEAPYRHQRKGTLYRVSVDVIVPGVELATTRSRAKNAAHADPQIAVRDAFRAARRRIQDHARRRRSTAGAAKRSAVKSAIRESRRNGAGA